MVKYKSNFVNKYMGGGYKILLIIPLVLFLSSIFLIYQTIQDDGTPIYRDISLKGGLTVNYYVNADVPVSTFINDLKAEFLGSEFLVVELYDGGSRVGFSVQTDLEEEKLIVFLEDYFGVSFESDSRNSSNFISPRLSLSFFQQAIWILIVSLVLMSVTVLLYFRKLVPSSLVVLSAIFDVVVAIGVLNLLHFRLSISGIGALLMIIGYSVDTDVLLTKRMVKEKDFSEEWTKFDKLSSAFVTGVLMTLTTLIACVAALIITNSVIIYEIAFIIVVGLLVDFVSTWITNAGFLLWWLEKRGD